MTTSEFSELPPSPEVSRANRLLLLFGAMYFVQGIAEPTEGLIAQPVRSLLKAWGHSAAEMAGFAALLALPWSIKPLYGLLTDFVPLAGTRRRSYLLLTSAVTILGLGYLYFFPPPSGAYWLLLTILLLPTVGVAFSDVVVDGLMVETGQRSGLTGRLQSVQWAALYGSGIFAALVGGWLSEHRLQGLGFLICGVATLFTFVLTWRCVKEDPSPANSVSLRQGAGELRSTIRNPAILAATAFLFLWNFNPFSTAVLYVYLTEHLGLSEQFYGTTAATLSAGAVLGSLAYGTYCRRVPMNWLLHLAIGTGVLATLAYWGLAGRTSALVISGIVGFTYMTGSMVQLDLAARACPVSTAGTTFATLMAVSNLGVSLSVALGGQLYDFWKELWGATPAFNLLVAAGAVSTSACWLLVPWMNRVANRL